MCSELVFYRMVDRPALMGLNHRDFSLRDGSGRRSEAHAVQEGRKPRGFRREVFVFPSERDDAYAASMSLSSRRRRQGYSQL
jgi:hypothetical protein